MGVAIKKKKKKKKKKEGKGIVGKFFKQTSTELEVRKALTLGNSEDAPGRFYGAGDALLPRWVLIHSCSHFIETHHPAN